MYSQKYLNESNAVKFFTALLKIIVYLERCRYRNWLGLVCGVYVPMEKAYRDL